MNADGAARVRHMASLPGVPEHQRECLWYALANPRMLEFLLFLISGVGYGLYFDLNPAETGVVAVVLVCVFRGWAPDLRMSRAGRAWTRLAHRRKTAVLA